ncbi:hypothetical protein LSH36_10g10002 [Paralvinella palmiformis]|uniref:Uncharacterized protein n=1 Tax=Paralvinella palmiformis TaxID=53620 RepID=A0AAD9NI58_9ANNE|nr:hypothetical protein LSH36_10g10002 [Paralvinella palmiformis]
MNRCYLKACYYCRQCHGDIMDVRSIKKCRCKTCKYNVGHIPVHLACEDNTFSCHACVLGLLLAVISDCALVVYGVSVSAEFQERSRCTNA